MTHDKVVWEFARTAIERPSIDMTSALALLETEPYLRARAKVDFLIASSTDLSAAAADLTSFVQESTRNFVAFRPTTADADLSENQIFDAVLPAARSLMVRAVADGHPEIKPLLALAAKIDPSK